MATMDGVVSKRLKLDETVEVGDQGVGVKDKGWQLKDKEHLLNVFSDEVWGKILERVTDSKTRENLTKASTFFRDKMLDDRTLFLFPEVWEVLANWEKKNAKGKTDNQPEPEPVKCGDCGKMRKSSRHSWILNLRLVCKTWCNSVDNSYQNGGLDGYWAQTDFSGEPDHTVIPFMKHFEKTHGKTGKNPFLSRTVTLELKNMGPFMLGTDGRQQAELDLLGKYGHHIWHCAIDAYDRCGDKSVYYTKLKQWLELMPNLKNLNVYSIMYDPYDKPNLTDLKKLAKASPLPKLKNLSYMILAQPVPAPIVAELIRSNGHVTRLDVQGTGENKNFNIYGLPLPNLEHVTVVCTRETDFQLLESPKVNWPVLKRLVLIFDDDSRCPFIKWDRVFSMLERKFKDTLTTMICQLPKAKKKPDETWIVEQCHNLRLNLPKVTNFSTRVSNATCLDFLLPMKTNLDYLQISIDPALAGKKWKKQDGLAIEKKQQIQIMGYTDRLLDSNIWTLFPKLKLVDVNGCFGKPNSTAAIVKKSAAEDDDEDEGDHFRYSRSQWYELQKRNKK